MYVEVREKGFRDVGYGTEYIIITKMKRERTVLGSSMVDHSGVNGRSRLNNSTFQSKLYSNSVMTWLCLKQSQTNQMYCNFPLHTYQSIRFDSYCSLYPCHLFTRWLINGSLFFLVARCGQPPKVSSPGAVPRECPASTKPG